MNWTDWLGLWAMLQVIGIAIGIFLAVVVPIGIFIWAYCRGDDHE